MRIYYVSVSRCGRERNVTSGNFVFLEPQRGTTLGSVSSVPRRKCCIHETNGEGLFDDVDATAVTT